MRRIWTARRSRRTIRSAAPRSTAGRSASPPDRGWGCGGGPNPLRDALRRGRPSSPGSPHLHVRSAASPRGARGAGVARGGAGAAPLRHLVDRLGLSRAVLDGLVKQGLARYTDVPRPRDPFADLSSPPPPSLTEGQRAAVAGIAATPADIPVLIHGVTGSGKTLV